MRQMFFASMFSLTGLHSVHSYGKSGSCHVVIDNHEVVINDPQNVVISECCGYKTQITFLPNEVEFSTLEKKS